MATTPKLTGISNRSRNWQPTEQIGQGISGNDWCRWSRGRGSCSWRCQGGDVSHNLFQIHPRSYRWGFDMWPACSLHLGGYCEEGRVLDSMFLCVAFSCWPTLAPCVDRSCWRWSFSMVSIRWPDCSVTCGYRSQTSRDVDEKWSPLCFNIKFIQTIQYQGITQIHRNYSGKQKQLIFSGTEKLTIWHWFKSWAG